MTQLTKEEIEMIKREAFDLYPHGLATPVKEGANIIRRIAHAKAATKYLTQLKQEKKIVSDLLDQLDDTKKLLYEERERAGKLFTEDEVCTIYDLFVIEKRQSFRSALQEYKNNKP